MNDLTAKQEKFVQGIVSGMSQREAYKSAYNCSNMKDKTIDEKASRMMKASKVRARYDELMAEHKDKALWTREQAVQDLIWIKDKAREDIRSIGVKQANSNAFISAIKELNQLEDLYPKDIKDDSGTGDKTIIITNEDEMRKIMNESVKRNQDN